MQTLTEPDPPLWEQISPLLDEAMGRLDEKDRNAIVLRFFENRTPLEAAAALKLNEVAARKRVSRALEKLRTYFAKRGVVATTAIIAGAISSKSVQAAPAALANPATAVVIAKGAAASASSLTLAKGALSIMAWTKAKTVVAVAATAIVFGTGTTVVTTKIVHAIRVAHYPNIAGIWEGVVHLEEAGVDNGQQAQAHVVLRLFKTNGVYQATTDWPEWGKKDVPTVDVVYDYPNLVIHPTVRDTWNLKVSPQTSKLYWDRHIHFIAPDPATLRHTPVPTPVPEPLTESDFAPRPGSTLQGYWEGKIGLGTNTVTADLKIARQDDGTFRAEGDLPLQGVQGRPVTVSYNPPLVQFGPADGAGMFRGQLNDATTEISGTWTQGGQSIPAIVRRADYRAVHAHDADKDYSFVSANDLQGHWQGTWRLTIGTVTVPMREALDIAKLPDGSYSAAAANVDELGKEAPVPTSHAEYSSSNLHLEWEGEGWAYDGKLQNGKIVGTWSQGGGGWPLVFERTK